jgi:hypothetical protein
MWGRPSLETTSRLLENGRSPPRHKDTKLHEVIECGMLGFVLLRVFAP